MSVKLCGVYSVLCQDSQGNFLWREDVRNLITSEGLNRILGVMFAAGTQIPNWYIGLINNSGFSAVSVSDTAATHTGWTEFTGYTSATRVAWSPLTLAGAVVTSTNPIQITFTSQATVRGFFLASDNTKGGSSGILWNAATFSTARTINSGSSLTITLTIRSAGGV